MKKYLLSFLMITLFILGGGTAMENTAYANTESPENQFELNSVHPVAGRQGICVEGDFYWVSGSTSLTKYDRDWNVTAENTDPFKDFELEVNHIGDIDVYQNELYLGVEYFMDGVGSNIQVAVYDGDTLGICTTWIQATLKESCRCRPGAVFYRCDQAGRDRRTKL